MLGLWSGYIVYGLVFTYHIHTHVYYQLPFIPIVAISLGPLGALVLNHLIQVDSRWYWHMILGGVFLLAILLNIGLYLRERQELPDFGEEVRVAEEIGEAVAHSTRTLLLASHYGRPLQYHGRFSGEAWPTRGDMRAEKLIGESEVSIEDRFSSLRAELAPEYFVITDFQEFDAQTDLGGFLRANFPITVQTDDYIIFGLQDSILN
jgi:hypothetical protein